jgi:hypothetical protein
MTIKIQITQTKILRKEVFILPLYNCIGAGIEYINGDGRMENNHLHPYQE